MELDEELCLCFHITRRKVANYIRIENPKVASQLSECGGAGTGCGWCRPFLERMLACSQNKELGAAELPNAAHYASDRSAYVKKGGGTPPPGATPVE